MLKAAVFDDTQGSQSIYEASTGESGGRSQTGRQSEPEGPRRVLGSSPQEVAQFCEAGNPLLLLKPD